MHKIILWLLGTFLWVCAEANATPKLPLEKISLPEGFQIGIFASEVKSARQMALGSDGTVYVGTSADRVYALPDRNRDGRADQVIPLLEGLKRPNGVAFRNGTLWIAETHRLSRIDQVKPQGPQKAILVTEQMPNKSHHGARVLEFSPKGELLIGIGSPCNVCLTGSKAENPLFGTISRIRIDQKKPTIEPYAEGIRNSVGFDWEPGSGNLWFTDNGRDWLGDDSPPDELNVASRPGQNFGFPFCHGRGIRDPEFGKQVKSCKAFQQPAQELGPHVAALGMTFYSKNQFPPEYRGSILIAEHGSWNRSEKTGYRISWVQVKNGRASSYRSFASGWLQGSKPWGRPVDVLVLQDGSLLVSDDFANVIYRISYKAPGPKSKH